MLKDFFILLFIIARQLPMSWIRGYVFRDRLRWDSRVYWLVTAAAMLAEFAVYLADGRQIGLPALYGFPLMYVALFLIMVKGMMRKKIIVWLALDNFFVVVQTLVLLLVDLHGVPGFWPRMCC